MFINVEFFERERIPVPNAQWDWDLLLELVRRFSRPEAGEYGYAGMREEELFISLVWQRGGRVFDPNGFCCHLAESEGIEAANMLTDLWKCSPANIDGNQSSSDDITRLFCDGKIAVLFGDCWNHIAVRQKAKHPYIVLPLPKGKSAASFVSVDGYAIRRGTQARALADIWLRLIAGIEKWPDYIDHHPGIPLHADIPEPKESLAAYHSAISNGRVYLSDIMPGCRTEQHCVTFKLIEPAVRHLLMADMPATRILAILRDQINALLSTSPNAVRTEIIAAAL